VGNTATFKYLDTAAVKKHCQNDKDAIERECKPESEDDKKKRQKGKGGLLSKLKLPKAAGNGKPDSAWIGDHCEFLMFKPGSADEMFGELSGLPEQMAKDLGVKALESAKDKAADMLADAVKKKVAKMAAKQAILRVGSFLAGPWVGIAVNVAMTADGANDLAKAVKEFPELRDKVVEASKALEAAEKQIKDIKGLLDGYKDPKTGELNKNKLISDMMEGAARLNPCITARRCQLVPFNQTYGAAPLAGKGCCPGQSGHHVLPSSMFKDCPQYDEKHAPTICAEGATNAHGSHGKLHKNLKQVLDKEYASTAYGSPMSRKDAIDAGVESVQRTFPDARCSEQCLRAQLESHYKKIKCKPKKANGFSGNGKDSSIGTTTE
jgi:GHH signature containing HNH/Endo VII superfamily nuclease toxin  2